MFFYFLIFKILYNQSLDSKGERVITQIYTIGRPYDRMDVDMRAYGKGLYWVEIGDANGSRISMCRVVIQ